MTVGAEDTSDPQTGNIKELDIDIDVGGMISNHLSASMQSNLLPIIRASKDSTNPSMDNSMTLMLRKPRKDAALK